MADGSRQVETNTWDRWIRLHPKQDPQSGWSIFGIHMQHVFFLMEMTWFSLSFLLTRLQQFCYILYANKKYRIADHPTKQRRNTGLQTIPTSRRTSHHRTSISDSEPLNLELNKIGKAGILLAQLEWNQICQSFCL